MKKILFIQLPLSDHGHNYVDGNVQCAPATLSAFIKKRYNYNCSYLADYFVNYVSDETLIKYIINFKPDILCFTLFLWNSERVIYVCEELKRRNFNTTVIIGGAEVQRDSWIMESKRNGVDIFVYGEGEFFFEKYFTNDYSEYLNSINGNSLFIQPSEFTFSLQSCSEPFSDNYINVLHDGSVFYEHMRGCPYRCIYCNYSGHNSAVREREEESLLSIIVKAAARGVSEIYLLAPSLERSSNFNQLLERIAQVNTTNIRLHSELRTEYIDEKRAKLLYKAGFRSLEIGLQTLNPDSLKLVGRKTDIEKVVLGIDYLIKQGIELKIGIIPGLPGDSPKSFIKTIDFLYDRGLGESIEFYPLMVLPGTKLRSILKDYSIQFQDMPPYHILSSDTFPPESFSEIKEYLEEKTGLYTLSHTVPDLICDKSSSFFKGAFLDLCGTTFTVDDIQKDSYHFTWYIRFDDPEKFYNLLPELIGNNGHLYSFVLIYEGYLNEEYLASISESYGTGSLTERLNVYNEWIDTLSIRFFQIFFTQEAYSWVNKNYNYIEPFILASNLTMPDYSLILTPAIYIKYRKEIIEKYSEYSEKIAFTDEYDFEDFFTETNDIRKIAPFNIYNYSGLEFFFN
ncbi:MAG: radical SAM protein [Spirochaetes bacterium]|jgi:radical SAM superfamily enzyme YgiQ (UPF0313 family)|nr:radical SAM protein [Spirochaetota bacterium]